MSVNITQKTVANAKAASRPGARQTEITDSRAEGLRLRIGARGLRWQYRCKIRGANLRLDMGSVDEWSIAEARDIANLAQNLVRGGVRRPDGDWLFEQRVRLGKLAAPATPEADPRLTLRWSWEDGKREYLEEVLRTLKPRTYTDYKSILGTPELGRFAGRPLASITLAEMSAAIGDVHRRGVERHAEHVASVVRPMWKWLGSLHQQEKTGLQGRKIMSELEAPTRSRAKAKSPKYTPPMHEIGRMLVIARSNAFHPVVSAAIETLILTVQRVTAVTTMAKGDAHGLGAMDEGLWLMPPQHRKTAEKRGDEGAHIVPLPQSAWSPIYRMLELHDDDDPNPYLFRGQRPRRAGDAVTAIAASNVQHAMMYSPGITMRPHDVRRAFTRWGSKAFGWTLAEAKSILDHNEG